MILPDDPGALRPDRPHFRYAGGIPAVTVYLPSGRHITVNRGDEVEVLAIEAEALDGPPRLRAGPPRS